MQKPFRTLFRSITTAALLLGVLSGAARVEAQSLTVTTLHRFSASDGVNPYYGLTQAPDGTLYGTTTGVEQNNSPAGSVFGINPDGTGFTVIHAFSPTESTGAFNTGGANPLDGPLLIDGMFYGVTYQGGAGAYGVFYRMATNGANYTVLAQFGETGNFNVDVEYQTCGIVQGSDGLLYGSGNSDGINSWADQTYRISTNGTGYANVQYYTYSSGGFAYNPLLPSHDGCLYGVTGGDTGDGDPNNFGTIFKLTTGGTYTDLHDFAGNDGNTANGALIEDANGVLYGTTSAGGVNGYGALFRLSTNGTSFTILHQFGTNTDGQYPIGRLLLASDGYLYGAAQQGGTYGYGNIFRMATNGANYQILYNFTGAFTSTGDHGYPNGCLIQASNGMIYGMAGDVDYNYTYHGNGTIFELTPVAPAGVGISSIDRVYDSPTNLSSVQWTVTFAAAVTGLNATNFQLVAAGLTGSPAITSVTGSGTTYTVAASTGSGTGTLQLNLANTGGISPSVTNSLPYSGQSYSIDLVPPTIAIGAPSVSITNNGSVSYTVTYADANFNASTLASGNITVNGTGTAAAGTVTVTGTGTTRTVTLSNLSGNGTLGISIAAGTASDTAGNLAPAAGPSTTFTVDNMAPTIAISAPPVAITNSGPVNFTVTYSDANFNTSSLNGADITVNATGTALPHVILVQPGSGATRTVTLADITGDGTLGISIAAGTASDTAGNLAPAAGPSTTFAVDNTPPTITIGAPSLSLVSTNSVSYSVTYADANFNTSTLTSNNITVNATGNAQAASVVVTGSGTSYTVTLSGISGQGSLGISIAANTASDTAGNLAPAAGPSAAFTVDLAPLITTQPSPQSAPALGSATLSVTASGTTPLYYQWSQDGTPLGNATGASLTLTNLNRASVGYYSVTVSNAVGLVASTNVLLRVLIPQKFGQVLQPANSFSPTFQALFRDTNGTVATLWYATNFFQMLGSTNIVSDWEPINGTMSLTNGWLLFQDGDPTNLPYHRYRFYRVEEQ